MPTTVFDTILLIDKDGSFRVVHALEPKGHFVIAAPRVYQGGLNTSYDVAKVNRFADCIWIEVCSVEPRSIYIQGPYNQCALLAEYILWQEAQQVLWFAEMGLLRDISSIAPTFDKTKALALGLTVDKAERKLKHFLSSERGTVKTLALAMLSSVLTTKRCFLCKCNTYCFRQGCESCDYVFSFCMNDLKNARSVCSIPRDVRVVYQRYSAVEMKNKVEAVTGKGSGSSKLQKDLEMYFEKAPVREKGGRCTRNALPRKQQVKTA